MGQTHTQVEPDAYGKWMLEALAEARKGMSAGEVPVGAVLFGPQGETLARSHNRTIGDNDPTAHAEILCLRKAAKSVGNHRLAGCTLCVTLEPCVMCAGAVMHARLARLVYGACDPKSGACGGVVDVMAERSLNHHCVVVGGVLGDECGALLRGFFWPRR